jgi:hypothetical protein
MKKNWLKRFDFLNVPISLSYKNEYFYETKIGGILTFLLFLIIIFLISYEILILYEKSSFTLISNKYTELSQTIDFSKTPILFKLTDDKGKDLHLDNKLFRIEAYNIEMIFTMENGIKKSNVIITKLELEKCDKIYSNDSEYSDLNLSSYICIKPDQNLTSFGLLGDLNNPFKGIRIYINKCSGNDCYDDDIIVKELHNSKFVLAYLSLNSNMFYLKRENLKYQIFTKSCGLLTHILKRILFTYDIGRFELYDSVIIRKKMLYNYIIGNDFSVDIDLDSFTTNKKDDSAIAYISLHYGGNIIETRKKVQTIYEALSIIGNIFNIILTIFKVINSYYSNKILFTDIFRKFFYTNENSNIKDIILLNNSKKIKNINISKKMNMDLSNENCLNNNIIHKNKSLKPQSKKIIISTDKNSISNRRSRTYEENKKNIIKNKYIYFYLLPLWFLKKSKAFNNIYLIKDIISKYFSIEKIYELIKIKDCLEEKILKSKINNTELIKINHNNFENNCINVLKYENNLIQK